jgi:hypothetical protein
LDETWTPPPPPTITIGGTIFQYIGCNGITGSAYVANYMTQDVCAQENTVVVQTTGGSDPGSYYPSVTNCCSSTGQVAIINDDFAGTINDVEVNFSPIFISVGTFPVPGGGVASGNYGLAIPGLSTVGVYVTISTDTAVILSLSTGYNVCVEASASIGYAEFTGVDLSSNADITITLQPDGSMCV